tara:strand:+ start:183 stop:302 length:120 start_codon:yes stop_codon:yes gene_type:complete
MIVFKRNKGCLDPYIIAGGDQEDGKKEIDFQCLIVSVEI